MRYLSLHRFGVRTILHALCLVVVGGAMVLGGPLPSVSAANDTCDDSSSDDDLCVLTISNADQNDHLFFLVRYQRRSGQPYVQQFGRLAPGQQWASDVNAMEYVEFTHAIWDDEEGWVPAEGSYARINGFTLVGDTVIRAYWAEWNNRVEYVID